MADNSKLPRGELTTRTLAMPADTNQNGDIFGGWLLGQMDIAGVICASKVTKRRTVTVAVDAMTFKKPVYVGDVVSIYAEVVRTGTTSLSLNIEAWVTRRNQSDLVQVTSGTFTYVSIDDEGRPCKVGST